MSRADVYLQDLLTRYPQLSCCENAISDAFYVLRDAYRADGKLLVCGNGGSAADSEHIVGELMKGFRSLRPLPEEEAAQYGDYAAALQRALPALALSQHTALNTAFFNDVSSELIFAQQVYGYGRPGDVFLGLSTSGNSANVVHAANVAKRKGMKVLSLVGKNGGKLQSVSDVCIMAPATSTPEVQEFHLPIYHALCSMLEAEFFG